MLTACLCCPGAGLRAPSSPTHVGVVVPVECVALQHEPAPLPLLAHEASMVLLLQEPPIAVHPAQVPAGHPPAAQPGRHSCQPQRGHRHGGSEKGEQGRGPRAALSLAGSCSPLGLRPVWGLPWEERDEQLEAVQGGEGRAALAEPSSTTQSPLGTPKLHTHSNELRGGTHPRDASRLRWHMKSHMGPTDAHCQAQHCCPSSSHLPRAVLCTPSPCRGGYCGAELCGARSCKSKGAWCGALRGASLPRCLLLHTCTQRARLQPPILGAETSPCPPPPRSPPTAARQPQQLPRSRPGQPQAPLVLSVLFLAAEVWRRVRPRLQVGSSTAEKGMDPFSQTPPWPPRGPCPRAPAPTDLPA